MFADCVHFVCCVFYHCLEFQSILTQAPHLLGEVFPIDASLEDVDVDVNMSFLDGIVGEAISNGARPYEKPEDDDDDDINTGASQAASAFKMTPYEKPTEKTYGQGSMQGMGSTTVGPAGAANVTLPPGSSAGGMSPTAAATPQGQQSANTGEPQLVLRNVANVWGKQAPPPAQAPAPSVPTTSSFASSTPAPGPAGYGGFGATPVAAPPVAPVKTAEQLEKGKFLLCLATAVSHSHFQ